ncbi:MAG: restriction endonuclease [Desulfococcaceae bacterium]
MSLEEWLSILFNPPNGKMFIDYEFPTNKHKEEYINNIEKRSDEEIFALLLKFLIPSTLMPTHDQFSFINLIEMLKKDRNNIDRYLNNQYYRRLFLYGFKKSKIPPWEGITWILDLLPHFPKQAIEGLNSYILAHAQQLPDGRFRGLCSVTSIIRAKYISNPSTVSEKLNLILNLTPRDFEFLIERLYHAMKFKTEITPAQNDGGKDIIAFRNNPGKLEHIRIECKRYSGNVGVGFVRSLLGVVSNEKVNKGVLVTTSKFTKSAKSFADKNSRIELIDGQKLIPLMNEYLGPSWPVHLERLIVESQLTQTAKK